MVADAAVERIHQGFDTISCSAKVLMSLIGRIIFYMFVVGLWFVSAVACESFPDPKRRTLSKLAPLNGFVELCVRDENLCFSLTLDHPPSMTTLGIFATLEEWERWRRGDLIGFSKLLIVSRGEPMTPEKFLEFKLAAKKPKEDKQQKPPVNTLALNESIRLGILQEGDDVISSGMLARFSPLSDKGKIKFVTTVTVQSILQLRGETFGLLVKEQWASPIDSGPEPDGESTKLLLSRWIECIRDKNRH